MATADSKEAKQLEKVKRAFDKAYKQSVEVQKEDLVKYSLVEVDENGIEVYEINEETKKLSYADRKKKLLETMKQQYEGRTAKFNKGDNVYYAMYDKAGLSKGVYGDKKSSSKGYKAKINIGADGNYIELAENALYKGTSQEQGKETSNGVHKDAKSWDYYEKTIKSDGVYYDVLINVKDTGNDQYVYDITLKEADLLSDQQRSYDDNSSASNNIIAPIPENASNVNKMSLSADEDVNDKGYSVYGKDILYQALDEIGSRATSQETTDNKQSQPETELHDYTPNPEVYETEVTDANKLIDVKIENYKVE